jgi:hypothetical protein
MSNLIQLSKSGDVAIITPRLANPFRPSQWRLVVRAHAALESYAILQCGTTGVLVVGDEPLAVFEQIFLVIARRCAPFISPGFWTMGCLHDGVIRSLYAILFEIVERRIREWGLISIAISKSSTKMTMSC